MQNEKGEKKTCLTEAQRVVDGPRQEAYGHPYNNHGLTAKLWTAYIEAKYPGVVISGTDVAFMMILQKISRERNRHSEDNLVDIAGYARNAEMILEREAEMAAQNLDEPLV